MATRSLSTSAKVALELAARRTIAGANQLTDQQTPAWLAAIPEGSSTTNNDRRTNMVETKLSGKSMDQRIADRLKNSGDTAHADHSVVHGTGPTRTHTQIHHSRAHSYGPDATGVDIYGKSRGPANRRGEI
jgi:hypothetical protein